MDKLLSLNEFEDRNLAKEDFKYWSLLEEIFWRQKSKELWLKEGDINTGYFHRMANAYRRRNFLKKMRINGSWCKEEAAVKRGVVGAFHCLFSKSSGWRPSLAGLDFKQIEGEAATKLEYVFIVEEVFAAVSDLNGDNAPGTDGFPLAFW